MLLPGGGGGGLGPGPGGGGLNCQDNSSSLLDSNQLSNGMNPMVRKQLLLVLLDLFILNGWPMTLSNST